MLILCQQPEQKGLGNDCCLCFPCRSREIYHRDIRASMDPEHWVPCPWGPDTTSLSASVMTQDLGDRPATQKMGIQPTKTCFFCLAAFLSPLDNFLILIYWFNFWLAMVVVMMQIYPRKTGYFGNSLMLTHCTWILDPICPNQPQQARNWQQTSKQPPSLP